MEYTPATFLQTNFQDLLKSECENNCSFLFALHPENINKEILSGIGSAHIFVNLNKTLSKRMDYLQDIAVQKISNRAHEQIRKNSRRMKYPSMEQRMTFAFMQKMRLIRRN